MVVPVLKPWILKDDHIQLHDALQDLNQAVRVDRGYCSREPFLMLTLELKTGSTLLLCKDLLARCGTTMWSAHDWRLCMVMKARIQLSRLANSGDGQRIASK